MTSSHSPAMTPRPVWPVWLYLSALTLALAALAEWHSHAALAVVALGGAWLKGVAIIESFMALCDAPGWLRASVHGWLALLCGGLSASFLSGG
ncbi:hypothetical protein BXU06_11115 [Aquaspirillum sp. LM1]|uniref:cytochrome C oxidase subunit IV family protein n=1 Tax=Aquaspirillum sp. LM1 TaxID=1938604 RepID=UPI000983B4DF|nr:cytochrome C oxidase subunit IV family protein [Aquaspirillum sp. LM1]AQR65540.1 hypothetical protein BXU06_11115 [Aquaspirillum sp. LM1]